MPGSPDGKKFWLWLDKIGITWSNKINFFFLSWHLHDPAGDEKLTILFIWPNEDSEEESYNEEEGSSSYNEESYNREESSYDEKDTDDWEETDDGESIASGSVTITTINAFELFYSYHNSLKINSFFRKWEFIR